MVDKDNHFTHYTATSETVYKILVNGYAWVPHQRKLISALVPQHNFSEREPQEFGMVSFTQISPLKASKHQENFGKYGLMMSTEWCMKNGLRKVFYLKDHGLVFEIFKCLFQLAYKDLTVKIKYPDDGGWNMSYTNKYVALDIAKSRFWYNALSFYEFIEPAANKNQKEWRIIDPRPVYGFAKSVSEIIKNVDPPQGWSEAIHVVRFEPTDVIAFVCPQENLEEFRKGLPINYMKNKIVTV